MAILLAAHGDVGGDVVSAGGTGTYDLHATTGVTEIQAGSYALMDTAYAKLGLPFRQALFVVGTVISVRPDARRRRRRSEGARHGPRQPGASTARDVWFCSDEHVTFAPARRRPPSATASASCRRTSTRRWRCTSTAWLVDGDDVLEPWPIDLRGWDA